MNNAGWFTGWCEPERCWRGPGPVAGSPHPRPPHRAKSARRGPRRPRRQEHSPRDRRLRGGRGGPSRRHPLAKTSSTPRTIALPELSCVQWRDRRDGAFSEVRKTRRTL